MGRLIGYPKVKRTKIIIIRNPIVLKAVIICDSNYATDMKTRKSASNILATLGVTLLTCSSETQRTIKLVSTEA